MVLFRISCYFTKLFHQILGNCVAPNRSNRRVFYRPRINPYLPLVLWPILKRLLPFMQISGFRTDLSQQKESNNKYVKVLVIWHALQGRLTPAEMRGENATFMHRSTHTWVFEVD